MISDAVILILSAAQQRPRNVKRQDAQTRPPLNRHLAHGCQASPGTRQAPAVLPGAHSEHFPYSVKRRLWALASLASSPPMLAGESSTCAVRAFSSGFAQVVAGASPERLVADRTDDGPAAQLLLRGHANSGSDAVVVLAFSVSSRL
jgi:hypothetical protein